MERWFGWTLTDWSEKRLGSVLLPRTATAQPFVEPDWARIHRELDRKGMTLILLSQEYVASNPEGRTWRYTQFCEHYKAFANRLKRSMRQHRRAREKLFIDFAGPTVALTDGSRAQIFVAAMAASSFVFACAVLAQRLEDWIACMVRALHFYGGVPQLIVPDNPRAVISSPDKYESRASDTVQDFARYYGTSVLPARPRTPRDKASVESSVQVMTRWVLMRLRHHCFDNVAQVVRFKHTMQLWTEWAGLGLCTTKGSEPLLALIARLAGDPDTPDISSHECERGARSPIPG